MNEKGKIKVIKKGMKSRTVEPSTRKELTSRAAAREMVSTVSNWVTDLQTRKSSEVCLAFDSLFKSLPTPSN